MSSMTIYLLPLRIQVTLIVSIAGSTHMSNEKDTSRPEYDAELIKSGKRGKYVSRYRAGTNVAESGNNRCRSG
jgi:hypothetical protein